MSDRDAKLIAVAVLGLVALIVFLSSPPGRILADVLSLVPGDVWKWLVGIAAFVGLIFAARYLLRQ